MTLKFLVNIGRCSVWRWCIDWSQKKPSRLLSVKNTKSRELYIFVSPGIILLKNTIYSDTVDGRNPAPVDGYFIPLFTVIFFYIPGGVGFLPSTVWTWLWCTVSEIVWVTYTFLKGILGHEYLQGIHVLDGLFWGSVLFLIGPQRFMKLPT